VVTVAFSQATGQGVEYALSLFQEDDGSMMVHGLAGDDGRVEPIYTDTSIISGDPAVVAR
jgi:hypothetical protein